MTTAHEAENRPGHQPGRYLPDDLPPEWADAFEAVPRSLFLPHLIWAWDMTTATSQAIDRSTNPDAWLDAARANIPIVTQWDDGQHEGTEPGTVSTSSASMPSVVAQMLTALRPRIGDRGLNLGVGTGWDTGLLVHRLGDAAVTALDVDAAVAAAARTRLAAAGYGPEVVTGDGLEGWAPNAPYDWIMASFGLRQIPFEWVGQTRPGGVILAPFGTHYSNADALVRLTVAPDGLSASGPFLAGVEFMKARSQRLVWPQMPDGSDIRHSTTMVTPPDSDRFDPFPFAIGLRLPGVTHAVQRHDDGSRTLWLYSLTSPAWASARLWDDESEHDVQQVGGRNLWDEFETAYRWWDQADRPGYDRLALTVTANGMKAWLDTPARSWVLA